MDCVIFRSLGKQDYLSSWQAMKIFTDKRLPETLDEIWLLEHDPVFTQGQNGKAEHILNAKNIPIIQTDRGGQVTYHGPGQLIIYTLIDLKRKKLTIRETITRLEQSIIDLLHNFNILAYADKKAPGIYISKKKICSIGLRLRKGCTYHGLAFNLNMDLKPFTYIHPCGFAGLKMTQLADFAGPHDIHIITNKLIHHLKKNLVYTHHTWIKESTG